MAKWMIGTCLHAFVNDDIGKLDSETPTVSAILHLYQYINTMLGMEVYTEDTSWNEDPELDSLHNAILDAPASFIEEHLPDLIVWQQALMTEQSVPILQAYFRVHCDKSIFSYSFATDFVERYVVTPKYDIILKVVNQVLTSSFCWNRYHLDY